jgi:dihydrofolate reductase
MRVSIIAAVSRNGVIGSRGRLPWRLPADLRRFRRLTLDHHLVVGRATWRAIGGPLPRRRLIVVSRRGVPLPAGAVLAGSLAEALRIARDAGESEVFVGGGGEIYRQALPVADRLYLTRIHARFDGDVRFPPIQPARWRLRSRRDRAADEDNPYAVSFLTYERASRVP